ncbi:MAG: arylsulfatase [Akkermansiaceae bacterium]|jgi:arylsulfatase A-like enzyme|nr:arylsulfatase [Akkermansiaceae bacterium]MDP4779112.1 arylsulfatase [Akkermansiaceae bacterium]MDP4897475.1 arylsulfatase [Akkermansiaceae bacterium]MDP4995955.1 arylsulfatase [Akkermansiaceae bacterium]
MNFLRLFPLIALLGSSIATGAPADNERPNVILIYADDLGIGLLGCYGQKIIETPHIDKLAAEGMRFTNHYGGVYCAPARWSLLTGMHDGRKGGWGMTGSGLVIQRDAGKITEEEFQKKFAELKRKALPIPDNEVFLAQVANEAGYATAQFGKIDNGFTTWKERVDRYGWDFHEGFYDHTRAHGFYPPYLWRNGEKFELPGNTDPYCGKMSEKGDEPVGAGGKTYSQNVFIEGILGYIRSHKDQRFFLYHPTQLPHGPVAIPELHPDYANRKGWSLAEKKYASMVRMLDDHVGLIMAELKELGLDDKTAVFFTSDNGHELYYGPKWSYGSQKKADGGKADLEDRKWRTSEDGDIFNGAGGRAGLKRSGYQGGMQSPLIARWPGHFKAGGTSDRLTANYDFMATIAELIGAPVPEGKDSLSFLPALIGKEQSETHEYVVVNNENRKMGGSAVIARDGFKLVEIERKDDAFQLYDIKTDNEERHNVATKFPERLSELKAIFKEQMNSDRPDL